jgi:CRP-like cAMP-binding protein
MVTYVTKRGASMRLEETKLFKNTRIDLSLINILEFPDKFTIANEGEISNSIGVVLEGKIQVKAYSIGGKDFTLNSISPGSIFGDVLIYGKKSKQYPGALITKKKTKVAFIPNKDFEQYLFNDHDLLHNFLELLSEKAYEMNMKSKLLSQDTIRDKILFWLQQEKLNQKSNSINLNMTKEELANLLYVQRPSLSRELIKMRNEGLILFDRKTITLLEDN